MNRMFNGFPAGPRLAVALAATLLALTAPAWAALAAAGDEPARMEIAVARGVVTLDLREADLVTVLETLGERAGFDLLVVSPVQRAVSLRLEAVPLDEALGRLLAGVGHVILLAPPTGDGSPRGVRQLWLMGADQPAVTSEPAPMEDDIVALDELARLDKGRSEELLRLAGQPPSEEVLAGLGDALVADESALVRTRAAMALGMLGDARAVTALETALQDPSSSVRVQAANALAGIADERATRALGDVLLYSAHPIERVVAARGLWRHDTVLSHAYLAEAADDLDAQVREAATQPPAEMPPPRTRERQGSDFNL